MQQSGRGNVIMLEYYTTFQADVRDGTRPILAEANVERSVKDEHGRA